MSASSDAAVKLIQTLKHSDHHLRAVCVCQRSINNNTTVNSSTALTPLTRTTRTINRIDGRHEHNNTQQQNNCTAPTHCSSNTQTLTQLHNMSTADSPIVTTTTHHLPPLHLHSPLPRSPSPFAHCVHTSCTLCVRISTCVLSSPYVALHTTGRVSVTVCRHFDFTIAC